MSDTAPAGNSKSEGRKRFKMMRENLASMSQQQLNAFLLGFTGTELKRFSKAFDKVAESRKGEAREQAESQLEELQQQLASLQDK